MKGKLMPWRFLYHDKEKKHDIDITFRSNGPEAEHSVMGQWRWRPGCSGLDGLKIASAIFQAIMDSFFNDSEAKRIRTGVYADGCSNLVEGDFMDVISFFPQDGYGMVAEGNALFPVVSVACRDAEAVSSKRAFF